MACVLDADALLDFFRDEGAAGVVEDLLVKAESSKQRVWITSLTWAEVYFRALKTSNELAQRFADEMAVLPIEVFVETPELLLSRETSKLRVMMKSNDILMISSVALAKLKKAELWTTNKELGSAPSEIKIKVLGRGGAR